MVMAVHLHPWAGIALGVGGVALIVWAWLRLGRPDMPETRRRIRRASLVAMLVGIFILVRGLSFVDEKTDPSNYTVTWAMALLVVLLVLFLAFLDVMNNLRLHGAARRAAAEESRRRLIEAVKQARGGEPAPEATPRDESA